MENFNNTIDTIKDLNSEELLDLQERARKAMVKLSEVGAIELWGEATGMAAATTREWCTRQ